jgi:hypothetical protein
MAKKIHETPMLDELENGPWPSFITGIKRLRDEHPEERIREVTNSLLGQLEHSYETRKGYWKGGTVSVFGYGGGIIPRFSGSGQGSTPCVSAPPGMHYDTAMLRKFCDIWEKYGSGLRLPRPVRQHHVPSAPTTETSSLLRRNQRNGLRPRRRRSLRAYRHVLRRCRALRAVLRQRAAPFTVPW